jgi:hypothetical protein
VATAVFFKSIQNKIRSFFKLIENDWWSHGNRWLLNYTLLSLLRCLIFIIYSIHYLFYHFFTLLLCYALYQFYLFHIVFEIFVFSQYIHLYQNLLFLVFC